MVASHQSSLRLRFIKGDAPAVSLLLGLKWLSSTRRPGISVLFESADVARPNRHLRVAESLRFEVLLACFSFSGSQLRWGWQLDERVAVNSDSLSLGCEPLVGVIDWLHDGSVTFDGFNDASDFSEFRPAVGDFNQVSGFDAHIGWPPFPHGQIKKRPGTPHDSSCETPGRSWQSD